MTRVFLMALVAPMLIVGLLAANPALAIPEGDRLKLSLGSFDVYGTWSKKSCAAQTVMRSQARKRVGFSVYWTPGRQLYLMTTHPDARRVQGNQQVQIRFPNGEAMAFAMKRTGQALYTDIGFGSNARSFYRQIESNRSMRIEWPALDDAVDVDLRQRRELEAAMRHCRDWLRS